MTVAGTGTSGSTASLLNMPVSVMVDTNQYMYIADQANNRIQQWAPGACSGECRVGLAKPKRLAVAIRFVYVNAPGTTTAPT